MLASEYSKLSRVRYISSVSVIYVLTLLFAWLAFQPFFISQRSAILTRAVQRPFVPAAEHQKVISGRPIRLVIAGSSIDLPIDQGYYNSNDSSWSLSGYDAQFAMLSTLANNTAGDTFIYGHNNNFVFGALRHESPVVGSLALVYTDNNHIFEYKFQSSSKITPDDTSSLSYSGPPIMTIQTCTGSVNEWRTMYRFNFVRLVQ